MQRRSNVSEQIEDLKKDFIARFNSLEEKLVTKLDRLDGKLEALNTELANVKEVASEARRMKEK